jgi:hypothetical protein
MKLSLRTSAKIYSSWVVETGIEAWDERIRGLKSEDEIYPHTSISLDWRMRGHITTDAMILTGVDADNDNREGM